MVFKKLLTCVGAALILSFSCFGQDKEEYQKTLDKLQKRQHNVEILKQFLNSYPNLANAYFQIGKLYLNIANSGNSLESLQRNAVYSDSAIVYFGKVIETLDKKEYKNFKEFYSFHNALAPRDVDRFKSQLSLKIDTIKATKYSSEKVYRLYHSGFDYYKNSLEVFTDIKTQFPTSSQLYLLDDSTFQIYSQTLLNEFDSSKFFFESFFTYQKDSFPVQNNLQIEYREIKDYTDDGEEKSELYGNLEFWDYNNWLNNVKQIRKLEIAPLRTEISNTFQSLTMRKNELETDSTLASHEMSLNLELLDKIAHYENKSIIEDLLSYQIAKADLAIYLRNERNFYHYKYSQREIVKFYHGLLETVWKCQDLTHSMKSKIGNARFHKDFFVINFGSIAQFEDFLKKETVSLYTHENYCNLKVKDQLLYDQIEVKFLPKYAEYKGNMIPLFEQPIEMVVESGGFVTTKVVKEDNGDLYLTGYQNKSVKEAFVAKVTGQRILWLTKLTPDLVIKSHKFHHYGAVISLSEQGCLAVVHSISTRTDTLKYNTLYEVDSNGKEVLSLNLDDASSPLSASKLENGSMYLATFEENVEKEDEDMKALFDDSSTKSQKIVMNNGIPVAVEDDEAPIDPDHNSFMIEVKEFIVKKLDTSGDVEWTNRFEMEGELTSIHPMETEILVVCNIIPEDRQLDKANSQERNLYLVKLDQLGNIIQKKVINSNTSHFGTQLIPLENDKLLVVGFKGDYNINNLEALPVMSMVINKNLEVIESNLDD